MSLNRTKGNKNLWQTVTPRTLNLISEVRIYKNNSMHLNIISNNVEWYIINEIQRITYVMCRVFSVLITRFVYKNVSDSLFPDYLCEQNTFICNILFSL
jgi:hypothetical protein